MSIDRLDTLDSVITTGIDLKNRRIYFGALLESHHDSGSDFNWHNIELCIRAIHMMESQAPHKPIEIHMSSCGGDPLDMLRLIDCIEYSTCQFKFFGGGRIMSAATWIMACCDERYLYKNTTVLIHDSPSDGGILLPSQLSNMNIDVDHENKLQNRLNQIYADNSRMPKEFWDEIVKRDTLLSAEETVMLGLADKVLEPKKRGNLRKVRQASLAKHPDSKDLNKLIKDLRHRTYMPKSSKIELHIPEEQEDVTLFIDTNKE
jgi:ATP-dependent protease ClpP protease subunit